MDRTQNEEQQKSMEFAAHIRKEDGKVQTVEQHCNRTAELSEKYVKNIDTGNIAYVAGLLHDAGKFVHQFDEYIRGNSQYHRGEIDHSYAGAKYICEVCDEMGEEFYELSRFIARIIVSHHGLHDWVTSDGTDYLSKRIEKDENYECVKNHVNVIVTEDEFKGRIVCANTEYRQIRKRLQKLAHKDGTSFAFYMGMFERLMQSVLVDGDRTDTAEFMMHRKLEQEFDSKKIFESFQNNYELYMQRKAVDFSGQNETIVKQRSDISDRCAEFAKNKVGICQLIVPTGGGKTLSSLRFAIEYGKEHGADRIIYVAPYMSILEQNSDVMKEIVGEEYFLEHHSNVLQEINNKEELEEYELYTASWDMPVIATTMVQFLNTLFLGKTSSVRRMHRLDHAIIIMDEIQSMPLKCVNIFNLAMNFLKEICRSTIVLCSATQPDFTKSKYPIILDENSQMIGNYKKDFEVFKRTQILPCIKKETYTYDEATEFCYEKFHENGDLLLVVNTKKSVSEMTMRLKALNNQMNEEERAEIISLSTNLCPQHRREVIDGLREMLKSDERVICVTTPLIEAGVDISFRCVVRFMAGMDNYVQVAGRCNRNGEIDGVAPVYILNISEQDEKLGGLQEIKRAQEASIRFFMNKTITDYLSVDTMRRYFTYLYEDSGNGLSYEVNDGSVKTTLLNLLSTDQYRWGMKKNKNLRWSAQAFQTAGSLFKVIDNNAIDVIVPYNEEARAFINTLETGTDMVETKEILRKAQKYVVSIYSGNFRKLEEEKAFIVYPCRAVGLRKEYYDGKLGVVLKEAEMELLMY